MTNDSAGRVALLLTSMFVALFSAFGTAWAAPKTKLSVNAPVAGVVPAGKIPVRAKLAVARSVKVKVARFYVNGKLVTTDRKYPFQVKKGVTFDTRTLPAVRPKVQLAVRYDVVKKSGGISTRMLTRNVSVSVFAPPGPVVIGQGGSDPQPTGPTEPTGPTGPYWPDGPTGTGTHLVFNDDFSGAALDFSKWNNQRSDTLNGNQGPNHPYNAAEGAAYGTTTNQLSVQDGYLKLRKSDADLGGYTNSTGMVNTNGKFSFKYGYIEARAAVPKCLGCWPALWVLPAANHWPPEIDIFEFVEIEPELNPTPYVPYATPHWAATGVDPDDDGADNDGQAYKNSTPGGKIFDYTEDSADFDPSDPIQKRWHTYGMWWTPEFLRFYVDGKLGSEFDAPRMIPHEAMYPIMLLSIGKYPYSVTAGKALKIDYLRVYAPDKQ